MMPHWPRSEKTNLRETEIYELSMFVIADPCFDFGGPCFDIAGPCFVIVGTCFVIVGTCFVIVGTCFVIVGTCFVIADLIRNPGIPGTGSRIKSGMTISASGMTAKAVISR